MPKSSWLIVVFFITDSSNAHCWLSFHALLIVLRWRIYFFFSLLQFSFHRDGEGLPWRESHLLPCPSFVLFVWFSSHPLALEANVGTTACLVPWGEKPLLLGRMARFSSLIVVRGREKRERLFPCSIRKLYFLKHILFRLFSYASQTLFFDQRRGNSDVQRLFIERPIKGQLFSKINSRNFQK